MMRVLRIAISLAGAALLLTAATLEQLTLDQMIAKSTAIVRGRVVGSYAAARGPVIYTHYRLRVSESWKGLVGAEVDVVAPGGVAGGFRQTFSGAPRLAEGNEYLLFLWTGASGLTHIIGLSQGVFDLKRDSAGSLVAIRAASAETLLDRSGRQVRDYPIEIALSDLTRRIAKTLGGSATVK